MPGAAAVMLHSTLALLMAACVWRLWVLSVRVQRTGEVARAARSSMTAEAGRRGGGAGGAAAVYPAEIHAQSASGSVAIRRKRPAGGAAAEGGGANVSRAVPLAMRQTPAASALGEEVAAGGVTHAVVGSVVFETLPGGEWEPAAGGVPGGSGGGGGSSWRSADHAGDVLVWARALPETAAGAFPFQTMRGDDAVPAGAPQPDGYARSFVLAF
eukprot:jgi/Tetstr1/454053/TSEL_040972.t1